MKMGNHIIGQILSEGDFLAQKQSDFNDNYIVKANDVLYDLLAEIMQFSDRVLGSNSKIEILSKMRSTLSKKHGIKTQKNSPDLTIIVKYVVRTSRKTAHVYARVLDIAYRQDVMADELADFIRQNGGIDRIRESNANLEAVAKKKARIEQELNFIRALLREKTSTPISEFEIPAGWSSEVHDSRGVSEFFYPICVRVLGGFKVVGVVPMDKDFENEVLNRVYIDLNSKTTCTEVHKQQIAAAKHAISPEYLEKLRDERNLREEKLRAKKLANQQLALAA